MNDLYRYRIATPDDASAIFAVLKEIAPEIPVRLDSCTRQKLLLKRLKTACGSSNVWIAVTCDNQVAGFLMVDEQTIFRDNQIVVAYLDLSYGGVKKDHRGQNIFPALVAKMKEREVPLRATVKHANKSNMGDRLLKLRFTKIADLRERDLRYPDQDEFRWQPEPRQHRLK
jgi:hypothetical protein